VERLRAIATESSGFNVQGDPLTLQILAGELPLALAYLFPELDAVARLAEESGRIVSDRIVDLLDGEGLPAGRFLELSRPLLATWIRCGYMSRAAKKSWIRDDAWTQLQWLVLQTLRLSRSDGSQVFTHGAAGAWCPSLLDAALRLVGDRRDARLADCVLPQRGVRRRPPRDAAEPPGGRSALPSTSLHSEWAQVGLLRCNWSRDAAHLSICYHDGQVRSELNVSGITLWSGSNNPQLHFDGRSMPIVEPWEEVCWQSDEDVDYLELEAALPGGGAVQRQFLLARHDGFLFVADAVLCSGPGEIDYACVWPLSSQITYAPCTETREAVLTGKRCRAVVMPLALPEWKGEPAAGTLEAVDAGVQLRLRTEARRLLAPLFFDLDIRRSKKPHTWRRLTVAADLEIQRGDTAVGYRVQIGRQQWLFYRSLAPRASRSVLGQNFSTEFVAARFTRAGQAEKLIEIE
jgi:hypothetical protein